MAAISSEKFGVKLCEILKIDPKKTKTITIKVPPCDAVMVTVDFYLQDTEVEKVTNLIKEYRMVKTKSK
jgi:hypothetical protein